MDYKSIGRNIRHFREAANMSRESFAELLDISVSYLSALERGEKLPKFETYIRIVNTLGVSSDDLLADVLTVSHELKASELSLKLKHLPVGEQRRILNVVETMIGDAVRAENTP